MQEVDVAQLARPVRVDTAGAGPSRSAQRRQEKLKDASVPLSERHALLLQAWSCAFASKSVVYLSGPITTGPRFVEWYLNRGRHLKITSQTYKQELRTAVIAPNSRDLVLTAGQLRQTLQKPVLEPASLSIASWSQAEYLTLWDQVIERFVQQIVAMPGWQYSAGCAAEFYRAFSHGIPVVEIEGNEIYPRQAAAALIDAARQVEGSAPISGLTENAERIAKLQSVSAVPVFHNPAPNQKDQSLDRLAETINVAQFVSFEPEALGGASRLKQRYSRVLGFQPNHKFENSRSALETLLKQSADASINLRSYTPEDSQSKEFIYGIKGVEEATAAAQRLVDNGLWVIANETVDVSDGGVSGVLMGDVIEFAPDDTPRCVEKPGVASLPREWGKSLLSIVYGFAPKLDVPWASRLEFSIHPKPRGWLNSHTLGWEYASILPDAGFKANLVWPNRFSRLLGDKVFGLLVAHLCGLPVPRTKVINRRIAPFAFGRATDSTEVWLRTSPFEQEPGRYTTVKGWIDPFKLLQDEDSEGTQIPSIISQVNVPAQYSGAALVTSSGSLIIEGLAGDGEAFMKGEAPPENLPLQVRQDVEALYERARTLLGAVRFEWVHDGQTVWVVQLHRGASRSDLTVIVPGQASIWIPFDVARGLAELRHTLKTLAPEHGLMLHGQVGLTSHIADVIRRSGVPARLATGEANTVAA